MNHIYFIRHRRRQTRASSLYLAVFTTITRDESTSAAPKCWQPREEPCSPRAKYKHNELSCKPHRVLEQPIPGRNTSRRHGPDSALMSAAKHVTPLFVFLLLFLFLVPFTSCLFFFLFLLLLTLLSVSFSFYSFLLYQSFRM